MAMDMDNGGTISFDELAQLGARVFTDRQEWSDRDAERYFQLMDLNKDGKIESAELDRIF